jgi:hypothetical protein
MIGETAEAASKAASKVMYGGGATSVGSWLACRFELTGDDWTVLFGALGALAAIGGFLVTWYYKAAHLRLARQLAKANPEE